MLTVLVFAEGARAAAGAALAKAARGRFIAHTSGEYEDLLALARYGVVEPEVVVAIDGEGAARLRLTRLPELAELQRLIARACAPATGSGT